MYVYKYLLALLLFLAIGAEAMCQKLDWQPGRNDYNLPHQGVDRHFIVHVPQLYNGVDPIPVVLVFHGTGNQGDMMWERSKWPELCELENFITVFPSSWKYLLYSKGRYVEKWNWPGLLENIAEPDSLKDDADFIEEILDRIEASFIIDNRRVYATGFSNGSNFVHHVVIPKLNHRIAATAGCGTLPLMSHDISGNLLPNYTMIGTADPTLLQQVMEPPIPFDVQGIAEHNLTRNAIDSSLATLQLSSDRRVDSTRAAITYHFRESLKGADNEWYFSVLKDVDHVYPNGENNKWDFVAAPVFWAFFQHHQLDVRTLVKPKHAVREFPCPIPNLIREPVIDLTCLQLNLAEKWQLTVTDLSRRVWTHRRLRESVVRLPGLAKGLYVVTLRGEKQIRYVGKIVIY